MTTTANQIAAILSTAERYKNCYFWDANRTNASSRRREEFDNNYSFEVDGDNYTVRQSLDISCRNYYFRQHVTKNGRKTNIRVIKTAASKLLSTAA